MIHVCYTMRDSSGKYSKFLGTSIQSMLENTREKVTIHLIHDSTLSGNNRRKFLSIVYRFNQEIEFHLIDQSRFNRAKQNRWVQGSDGRVSVLYRLLIPELLDLPRAIYLDADTIVNLEIAELWSLDLENFPLGVVTELSSGATIESRRMWQPVLDGSVEFQNYFNSGILFMNLDSIRENFSGGGARNLLDKCVEILEQHPNYWLMDQDALNFLFAKNSMKLEPRFNRLLGWKKPDKIGREIYHFILRTLNLNTKDQFCRLWFEYFLRTPFATPESFGNLFDALKKFAKLEDAIKFDGIDLLKEV